MRADSTGREAPDCAVDSAVTGGGAPGHTAGWDYEAANWRFEQQARNLLHAIERREGAAKWLVYSGGGNFAKVSRDNLTPMGYHFVHLSEWRTQG